jgi:hypothetical protein
MSLPAARHIRPDGYPASERPADLKHEYVSGVVHPWGDPDHPRDSDVVLGLHPESRESLAGGMDIHSAMYKDRAWEVNT